MKTKNIASLKKLALCGHTYVSELCNHKFREKLRDLKIIIIPKNKSLQQTERQVDARWGARLCRRDAVDWQVTTIIFQKKIVKWKQWNIFRRKDVKKIKDWSTILAQVRRSMWVNLKVKILWMTKFHGDVATEIRESQSTISHFLTRSWKFNSRKVRIIFWYSKVSI